MRVKLQLVNKEIKIVKNIIHFLKKKLHKLAETEVSNQVFLEMAYKVIFERKIDSEGLAHWLSQLQQGLTRLDLVKMLIDSPEFSARNSPNKIFHALHNARLEMVQTLLPPAEVVLDLGGAHPGDPKGALLNFGYPYLPKKLYILDLPPNERMFPAPEMPQYVNYYTCNIEYVYKSMVDLGCFEEESFDLIWSGESIEHITVEEAEKVFEQAYKLLKPNGRFALDTPNRRATKLQCPNGYIHPEHKIEYYYEELIEIIRKYNFRFVESKGLIDLSESIRTSTFIENELIKNSSLNNNPHNSYMFYICCMRADS